MATLSFALAMCLMPLIISDASQGCGTRHNSRRHAAACHKKRSSSPLPSRTHPSPASQAPSSPLDEGGFLADDSAPSAADRILSGLPPMAFDFNKISPTLRLPSCKVDPIYGDCVPTNAFLLSNGAHAEDISFGGR